MRYFTLLLPMALILALASPDQADTIHVPADMPTIQAGINAAVNGDTVMVSPGTYNEWGIDFLGKAIVVTSTDPLDDAVVAATIVDGNQQNSVFIFQSGEPTTSVLAGFTIRNGHHEDGGGVRCWGGSPTVTRNVVTENTARMDGGGVTIYDSHAVISHNQITNNSLTELWREGGGIRIFEANPIISNNIISENTGDLGGGIFCNFFAVLTLEGNTVTNNNARNGGGLLIDEDSDVVISNSIFWGNTAFEGTQLHMVAEEFASRNSLTISYSNVEGGQANVHTGPWDVLNWGDGMLDTIPDFSGDGYHLRPDSPMLNAGDPSYSAPSETDIDSEARVLEGRIDIGADEFRAIHVEDQDPPVIHPGKKSKSVE